MPKPRLFPVFISLMLAALLLASGVSAQDPYTRPPTILDFSADIPTLTQAEVEAGDTVATLSWSTIGLTEENRLVLDRYDLNNFVSVLDEGETTLPPSGTREVSIRGTSTFAPPTFRLSILDFRNRIIDQRFVVIPVTPSAQAGAEPTITEFSTDTEFLDPVLIAQDNARVTVNWAVENRPLTANLIFEQVLPNGEVALVELPRPNLWIPSSGSGPVTAFLPAGEADNVVLRLTLMDLVDGTIYGQEELIIPLEAAEVQAAPLVVPAAEATASAEVTAEAIMPESTAAAEATTEAAASTSAQVIAFTATPQSVALGQSVGLAWEVENATSVEISIQTPELASPVVVAGNLPTAAGLTIPIRGDNFARVDQATFTLRAVGPNGESLGSVTTTVQITPAQ